MKSSNICSSNIIYLVWCGPSCRIEQDQTNLPWVNSRNTKNQKLVAKIKVTLVVDGDLDVVGLTTVYTSV